MSLFGKKTGKKAFANRFFAFGGRRRQKSSRRNPSVFQPRLEILEDRRLLDGAGEVPIYGIPQISASSIQQGDIVPSGRLLYTAEFTVALNADLASDYDRGLNCQAVDCAPCLPPEPGTSNRPYFIATCQANRCVAVDLRTTDVTECSQPSDCSFRFGSGCCEGCGGDEFIAIGNEALLSELVCPAELPPCLACEPVEPEGFTTDCQAGRCVIEALSP